MREKQAIRNLSIALQEDVYQEIVSLAEEHQISKTKVIHAILKAFIRQKKEREKK